MESEDPDAGRCFRFQKGMTKLHKQSRNVVSCSSARERTGKHSFGVVFGAEVSQEPFKKINSFKTSM